MQDFTTTFLLGKDINQDKVLKCMNKINEKAIKEIERGNTEAMFLIDGMHFTVVESSTLPDIDTDDEYILIVEKA